MRKDSMHTKKPNYFVNGYENEHKIHLGSYFLNPGEQEHCYLVFQNNDWYLNSEAWWPVQRDASNGGKSSHRLTTGYFVSHDIFTLNDFLKHIYRGNIAHCLEKLHAHKDVLELLDNLVKSKLAPNYDDDGLSLLWEWEYNETKTGIIIDKCLSYEKESITIPAQIDHCPVVEFGHNAFTNLQCRKLVLPDTLKKLNGIRDCRNITEITIPAFTETCCPFLGCDSLENIFVADGSISFRSVDGVLYTNDLAALLRCPEGKKGLLKISDKTLQLDSWACANCQRLTDVILPQALTKIGMYAFSGCVNVRSFALPDSITEISWGAFESIDRARIVCKKDSYAYNDMKKH